MVIFYAITSVVLAALISTFWMIFNESSRADPVAIAQENPNNEISAAALLERIGLEEKSGSSKIGRKKKSLFNALFRTKKEKASSAVALSEKSSTKHPLPASGTAALRLDNAAGTSDPNTDEMVGLAIKNDDLKKQGQILRERCLKIEALLAEKTEKLDKAQKELENEQKHRKDFNKVKDILEKEIKETKDAAKETESQLQSAKAEHQASRNRVLQLEEKIKNFEKKIFEKEDIIRQLEKTIANLEMIQQPASAAPPPEPELPPPTTVTERQEPPPDQKPPPTMEERPTQIQPDIAAVQVQEAVKSQETALEETHERLKPVSSLESNDKENTGPAQPQEAPNTQPDAPQHNADTATPDVKNEAGAALPISPLTLSPDQESHKRSSADEIVHLAPDIFKDVEKHLREIQEEMRATQEVQNIELDTKTDSSEETKKE